MLNRHTTAYFALICFLLIVAHTAAGQSRMPAGSDTLDARVERFLEMKRGTWRDMNVPWSDGKLLYDLIIKNGYRRALEIGTSTGHSTIWIAWALSKTGGKVITVEINEARYREALANFAAAGLSKYIDARLADAHKLVKELQGSFDFVFCDADKGWYKNYFIDAYPKLKIGGCYTAHNVRDSGWRRMFRSGTAVFYEYIKRVEGMDTSLDQSGNGLSISYKRRETDLPESGP
jgi:predicted O-methyltransferase YrrM